ncbi:MAG: carboxymuconolactone decarboxylase family protein [Gaiellaceae bacterium]
MNFERSDRFDERQKAALLYTSMLLWNPEGVDEALWARLREHFSEEQIVELGGFVALTFGQQRVIKTWAVGHNELPSEAGAGLAEGL